MIEERDRFREPGVIDRVFLGKEDHGILTCSIGIRFGVSYQSFGGLCLDEKLAPDFVRSLCDVFGVAELDNLKGQKCFALRCFESYSSPIEGLEAESGQRFLITAWRRRHFPETKNPLESARDSLEKDVAQFKYRLQEAKAALLTIDDRYVSWGDAPPVKSKRRGRRG